MSMYRRSDTNPGYHLPLIHVNYRWRCGSARRRIAMRHHHLGSYILRICWSMLLAMPACSRSPHDHAFRSSEIMPTKTIRAFAVSNHVRFADGESIAAYEAKIRALFDKRFRTTAGIVQQDVDDVAHHLLGPADTSDPVGTARDLVVFTEDVGLILALQGTAAASARDPSLTAIEGLLRIARIHLPQVLLNAHTFGVSINRALFLSLTDKFWRGFHDTFSRIADEYDVYLVACENVAEVYESTDPLLVRLFGDPEHPERTNVFLPLDGHVYNQAFLYDPDGRIVASTKKVYLTPPEEDPGFFDLSFGSIAEFNVIDTPVGRLALVISKDAWMPDVIDRAEELGAQIMVQPDANPGNWASVVSGNDTWFPDNWAAGNWMHTQKYPSLRYNITPMMTGNLYDFNFDGQASIIADTSAHDIQNGFVGQSPRLGFLAVGQWAIADPVVEDPGLSIEERRNILIQRSKAMAPYSGTPLENAYSESVLYADLHIPLEQPEQRPQSAGIFGTNIAVSPSPHGPCWNPSIGLSQDGTISILWTDLSRGVEEVALAQSFDRGRTFSRPTKIDYSSTLRGRQRDNHWDARLAVARTGLRQAAVWTDYRNGSWEIFLSHSIDGGRTWSTPATRVDNAGETFYTGENLLYDPCIAYDETGNLFVAWADNRTVSDTDIVLRKSTDGGMTFGPEIRVDDTGTGTLHHEQGTTGIADTFSFNPSLVAAEGKVYVVWQDLRDGWNAIYFARSDDAGETFGRNVRVNGSYRPFIHEYNPSIAVDKAGRIYVAWQDTGRDGGDIYIAISTDGGKSFGSPIRVDDATESLTTQSSPRVAVTPSGETLYVLWRDARYGGQDLFIAATHPSKGYGFSPAVMVNDQAGAPCEQSVGDLVADPSGDALVTWHDARDGTDAVYFARGRLD